MPHLINPGVTENSNFLSHVYLIQDTEWYFKAASRQIGAVRLMLGGHCCHLLLAHISLPGCNTVYMNVFKYMFFVYESSVRVFVFFYEFHEEIHKTTN